MKTRRPFPESGALARARALLLEVGVDLPLRSWGDLATLCDTAWLPVIAHPSPAAARVLRRRLRRLASSPVTIAAAAVRPRGELVHVAGRASALAGATAGPLWRVTREEDDGGIWLAEEGEDFLLTDPEGGRAHILAEGAHLVGAELRAGDDVSVFGFFEEIPDRTGLLRSPHGRGGVAPALRSGSDWPLLVVGGAAPPSPAGPQGATPVVR